MFAIFPGNSRIFSMSCEMFLGIPGILVDFDDLFLGHCKKNPRKLWEIYRNFLGTCGFLVDVRDISQETPGFLVCPVRCSLEFLVFWWILMIGFLGHCKKIPGICGKLMDT